MSIESSETPAHSPWQFSLRSLLLFTAAFAVMLSTMKVLGFYLLPSTILLFVALFLPVWLPIFFLPAKSLKQRMQSLLALIPAGWYLLLLSDGGGLFHFIGRPPLAALALGYCVAFVALAFSARGRRHLINVPLWLALAASAWAVFHG